MSTHTKQQRIREENLEISENTLTIKVEFQPDEEQEMAMYIFPENERPCKTTKD